MSTATTEVNTPGPIRQELTHILRHSGTVLTGQLAVMLYAVADSVIAGRYSADALAAFSVATAIYASVFVALMGVMQGLMPIYAEHHGANQATDIGRAWRQSWYLLIGLSLPGLVCLLAPHALLDLAKVPKSMQADVLGYLGVQAFSLPLALAFRAFSTLSQAIGRPKVVMWIQLASLPSKVALSWWFVFGGWGLPSFGAVGCAMASFMVTAAMFLAGMWMIAKHEAYAKIEAWKRLERPDWPRLKEFLRLGIPSGLSMLFEVTSFTLMAVLIARLGVVAAGAHQVAVNVAAVMFMVPLSLSIATSARVSFWIGAQHPGHARRVAILGVKVACLWALIGVGLLLALAPVLARGYSSNPELIGLAVVLLHWVSLYQAADTIQTICVFILRSYRVTILPFVVYAVVLWGLGLGGGMLLTYDGIGPYAAWRSPTGFWAAAVAALVLAAVIFWLLLAHTLRKSKAAQ